MLEYWISAAQHMQFMPDYRMFAACIGLLNKESSGSRLRQLQFLMVCTERSCDPGSPALCRLATRPQCSTFGLGGIYHAGQFIVEGLFFNRCTHIKATQFASSRRLNKNSKLANSTRQARQEHSGCVPHRWATRPQSWALWGPFWAGQLHRGGRLLQELHPHQCQAYCVKQAPQQEQQHCE